jgi:hypothetical protein
MPVLWLVKLTVKGDVQLDVKLAVKATVGFVEAITALGMVMLLLHPLVSVTKSDTAYVPLWV